MVVVLQFLQFVQLLSITLCRFLIIIVSADTVSVIIVREYDVKKWTFFFFRIKLMKIIYIRLGYFDCSLSQHLHIFDIKHFIFANIYLYFVRIEKSSLHWTLQYITNHMHFGMIM